MNIKSGKPFYEISTNYCNISEFRLFDLLLFPYNYIDYFRNWCYFISSIPEILKDLLIPLAADLFLFIFFSLLGLSLWRGRFNYLCHLESFPNDNTFPLMNLFQNTLCGGSNKCNNFPDLCLSTKNFYSSGLLTENANIGKQTLYEFETDHFSFNYGITKFDNFFQSLLSIFISSTGKGWVKILSLVMDSHSNFTGFIFFLIMEVFFFIYLNKIIIISVLLTLTKLKNNKQITLILSYKKENLSEKIKEIKFKKKYDSIKIFNPEKARKFQEALKSFGKESKYDFFIRNRRNSIYHKKFYLGYLCYLIY